MYLNMSVQARSFAQNTDLKKKWIRVFQINPVPLVCGAFLKQFCK